MKFICLVFPFLFASAATAETAPYASIVDDHVIRGYVTLTDTARDLSQTAQSHCHATSPELRQAYHDAFDAWVRVSHLRFGPSEVDDRSFSLAFWPDSRGVTPKTIGGLIGSEDQVAQSAESFATVSIAGRGFYAMEFVLFDPDMSTMGSDAYRCTLVQVMAKDIETNAKAILADWQGQYGDEFRTPGSGDTYRTDEEVARQLFTALSTGLEFTADTRLGRPLGTFERPRPLRAEAWRSGRSLRHVVLSLQSLRDLAAGLSQSDDDIDAAFVAALDRANNLDDPLFAGVDDPIKRFRVEALQQSISQIRSLIATGLAPRLGVSAGFNSADGD